MSDVSSPASPAAADALPLTRHELIEAVYELGRRVTIDHWEEDTTATTVAVTDQTAQALGAQILGNIRDRRVLDGDEAARAEVVVTELLDGGEARYAWERIADAEMYEAWVSTQHEHPDAGRNVWLRAAGISDVRREFPDAVFLAPVNVDPRRAVSLSREQLRATLDELVGHVGTDPEEYERGSMRWESDLSELAEATVSAIRKGEVVSAGEAARLERLVAASVSFEQVRGSAGERLWDLATDPDAYQRWLTVRAVSIQHAISADPLDWTNSHGEFVDAIRLRPFRADSLRREDYQLLDRAGIERAFAEIASIADPFVSTTRLASGSQNLSGHEKRFAELAETILATARHSDTLTAGEAGRAERVVATLAAGEYSTEIASEGRVWQLVTNPDAYTQWMSERNMRLHEIHGARGAAGVGRGGEFMNAVGLHRYDLDAEVVAEIGEDFLDRDQAHAWVTELVELSERLYDKDASLTWVYDPSKTLEEQVSRHASELLYTARYSDTLTTAEADRAERVVAALVSGERLDLTAASAWDAIESTAVYEQWLVQRGARREVEQQAEAEYWTQQQREVVEEIEFWNANPDLDPSVRADEQRLRDADALEPDWNSAEWRRTDAAIIAEKIVADPERAEELLWGADRDEVFAAIIATAHGQMREWQSLQADYKHLRGQLTESRATLDKAAGQAIADQRELIELRADRERLQSAAMDFAADLGITPAARRPAPQAVAPQQTAVYAVAPSPEFPVPVNTQSVEPSAPWWRPLSQGLGRGSRAERGASR
ncbi:hypothetical protein ACQPXH_33085 (plasmid) [Nocardia sp. CA-135953]|uniref:hypothetical protein n=1 Tax=Nocardia sp. CA-135953 TaxID=3239978 RepID=UPI003D97C894